MVNQPQFIPNFQCHKKVFAVKIGWVDGDTIQPADANQPPFAVPPGYVEKHKPKSGGYYVVYEDGYQSFSPAAAFESGYSEIEHDSSVKGAAEIRITDDGSDTVRVRVTFGDGINSRSGSNDDSAAHRTAASMLAFAAGS